MRRRMRRGQSEVVGAILIIPIIISIFIAGSAMMQRNVQQLELVNEKMREHLIVIPLYYNDTLYAKILNIGARPVQLAYIILYNVNGSARQLVHIQQVSETIAPGSNATLPIASGLAQGRYEVDVVTRLGNVFGWDPSVGPVFSIPPEDAVLSVNPVLKLSQLVGEALAREILEDYSIVGYESLPPVYYHVVVDVGAKDGGSCYIVFSVWSGELLADYREEVLGGGLEYTFDNVTVLGENASVELSFYARAWGLRSASGLRAALNVTITYNGRIPALIIFNSSKPDLLVAPEDTVRYIILYPSLRLENATVLGDGVVLFNSNGSITLSYVIWHKNPPSQSGPGVWRAALSGNTGFTSIHIIYLQEEQG